ncbi:MAG: tetratricopeptide repeat protein [Bacteroidales bacterium]|jgi:tetratricopeptide (TPR) repeat protein|nr:tetratricopeptide repeat protein [Bacteroidales bacterium]
MLKEKFYTLIENTELLNEESEQEIRDIIMRYPYFQAALILNFKSSKLNNFDETLKKIAVQIPQRKKLYTCSKEQNNIQNHYSEEYHIEKNPVFQLSFNEEKIHRNSLIDKFLSSNTEIIIPKKTNYDSEQFVENEIIKKSTKDNDEIITETLAILYYNQKKYDKALETFRKLSLKYPEKNTYFATKIYEIEKLKNT